MQNTTKYMRVNNPKMPAHQQPYYRELAATWTVEGFLKSKSLEQAMIQFNDFCYAMEALPGFSPSEDVIAAALEGVKNASTFNSILPFEYRHATAIETMNSNLVNLYLDLRRKLICLDSVNHKYNTKQDAVLYSDNKRYHLFDANLWKIANMNFQDWGQIIKAIEHMHNALTNNFTPIIVAAPGTKFENNTERFLSDHWNGFDVLKVMLSNDQEFNYMMVALLNRDFYNAIVIKNRAGKEVTVTSADHDISYHASDEYLQIVKKVDIAKAA